MTVILPDYAEQLVARMTNPERKMMIERLRELIAEELSDPGEPDRCPHCGCREKVRKGHGADGSQRWLCKGCARTFSAKTLGLLSSSKLEPAVWMTFAECMADVVPLRETALRCGVSLYTAWYMRMRVCEVLRYRMYGKCRAGTFQVDGTYLVRSLKGNHKKCAWFEMPRDPHRNGQDGRRGNRAKSDERSCVVCGVNELGDEFCVPVSSGAPHSVDCMWAIHYSIPEGSTIITDDHKNYSFLDEPCSGWDFRHVVRKASDKSANINLVNSLHSRLKSFLVRFRGVATRRLDRYCAWFAYADQVRGAVDRRELLFGAEADGRYVLNRKLTHQELRDIDVCWSMCDFPRKIPGLVSMLV